MGTRLSNLILTILLEAYNSKYYLHSGSNKMYRDLRQHYRDEVDIVDFITKC